MTLWHAYLKKKCGTQDGLVSRWLGLLPGESLAKGTILPAPLRSADSPAKLNDANPKAYALFNTTKTTYGRDDFNRHRGEDVNEFLAGLLIAHIRRVAAAFKTMGSAVVIDVRSREDVHRRSAETGTQAHHVHLWSADGVRSQRHGLCRKLHEDV